jgi:hypothetical protein
MGTDNLFHKRKAKQTRDLERQKAKRDPYAKVLVVCEGEQTEPCYFSELKDHYEINSANITVDGSGGSSPISVVEYGKQLYEREKAKGDPFDRVYCVFDKDTHATYQAALNMITAVKRPQNTFVAINSVPCFEYWLLLHFTYTTAPFIANGGASAADAVINRLREYMPAYTKASRGVFNQLFGQLEIAKTNAARSLAEAQRTGTDNPTTRVHELVDYLQNIKPVPG